MPSEPARPRLRPTRSAALRGAVWITLIALLTTGAALTLQYVGTTRLLEARQRSPLGRRHHRCRYCLA